MGAIAVDRKSAVPKSPPEPAHKIEILSPARRPKILVVEVDERVGNVLGNLLQEWGYVVELARDGLEGWERIVESGPAVVVSDVQMPGLTGLELLRRTRDLSPHISFIMLTGHGTIPQAVEATRLGAFDFLEKTADPANL
jgi:two-component system C4-dicarboxylate transport response regulator DctD